MKKNETNILAISNDPAYKGMVFWIRKDYACAKSRNRITVHPYGNSKANANCPERISENKLIILKSSKSASAMLKLLKIKAKKAAR